MAFEEYRKFTKTLLPINVDFADFEEKYTQDRAVFRRMKVFLAEIMILQGNKTLSAARNGAAMTAEEKEKCTRTSGVLQALHTELIADKDRRAAIQPALFQRMEELQK